MNTLLSHNEYAQEMRDLRARNKYAANWTLQIVRKTNRHPETNGQPWGWYEIFPLGITVGYWGSNKDDLTGVDIEAWNLAAQKPQEGGE